MVWYDGSRNSVIRNRSFNFTGAIVRFTTVLKEEGHYNITRQVLRSGTSIGANIK